MLQPAEPGEGGWAFVVLPPGVSAALPRRGRTTVEGTINGRAFTVVAEPDGRKGHWIRLDEALVAKAGARVGEVAEFAIAAAEREIEPSVPADLAAALDEAPEARATWEQTTTIARIDWVHWIVSARQAKTRAKRVRDACEMLAEGKKRVCCFDPSGFYSKAFSAPQAVDAAGGA